MLVLIAGVFRVISLVMVLETGGPSDIARPRPVLALELAGPHPLSLTIGRQGIWSFVLKRDEDRRLHSSSIREVAQLKAHVDYLLVALQVAEEEVTEERALATATRVRAYGEFPIITNSYSLGSCS